ncbi:MAG: methyltransferase domain-containing protein [Propionibacteriales bacterium]|nr:methyltransferase domain-containing protein [Propionibacteriales bacterium]
MSEHDGTDPYVIDWADWTERLSASARDEAGWYRQVAKELVRPGDGLAIDVGCGGGGMAVALAEALPDEARVLAIDSSEELLAEARANLTAAGIPADRAQLGRADLEDGPDALRAVVPGAADLVWESAAVHHVADQQAAVDALAGLLAPGGRLALAEDGLSRRCLPWDIGVGEPGLEVRLEAANDVWFRRMRRALPGWVPMPYGWTAALDRAGLVEVGTRTWLLEKPAPLPDEDRTSIVDRLGRWVERLTEAEVLPEADLRAWERLLDPDAEEWLGHRDDLYSLQARSVHVGHAPG